MRWRRNGLLLLVLFAACSNPDAPGGDPLVRLAPTLPMPLSPGNTDGQDEDPAILIARDGSLFAAWYSNRLGLHPSGRERKEIFVVRSTDGATWSEPAQATESPEWSFYPSLAQSADGVFHLVWMRWRLLPQDCVPGAPGCPGDPQCCTGTERRIVYNRSADGLTWTHAQALELSPGPADELASLVATADGRLLVYYVSGYRAGEAVRQIFLVAHDGTRWSAPILVGDVSSSLHHDTFPNVAEGAQGELLMAWTRYDLAEGDNLFNTSTRTMFSTSPDAVSWTPPVALQGGAYAATIDVFPHLYPDHARQTWFVAWVTEAGVVELPVAGAFPADLTALDIPGYTPRILPTATPGIYWAAWAEGVEPRQKVRQRFFAK